MLLIPCDTWNEEAASHENLWEFVVGHVSAVTGLGHTDDASVALWAFLHGTAELEAAKIFGDQKPTTSFDFGLNAWLAAASSSPSKAR